MFGSIEEVQRKLAEQKYICSKEIATVIFLAERLEKPVLVEGPAGVGKTDLGKVTAAALGREFIRLQCYEGLDESKSLYEWEYAKQLLYTQILKDVLAEELAGARDLAEAVERVARQDEVFFSQKFIVPRPLLRAILSEKPALLLIDEVDKSDPEFEAFLLEILSDFQVSIPELSTIKARHIPMVILTSNNSRELSDALKRRCLHLFIDFPTPEQEMEIVRLKVPGISESLAEQVVAAVHRLRRLDLKKVPGISETLDWARALVVLNAEKLEPGLVRDTLNIVLKYEKDIRKAEENLHHIATG
ncbi:AAA family ATPase [Candidatus Solincola sp.]|jgi:MoxR-like ATPase|nr:MoxR family ATPase [Actinomycetota bacterium]